MVKQNVTLSVPKDILKKARLIAVERDTSLSALMTQALTEIVERHDRYAAARISQLALMEEGYDFGSGGRISWDRESLHER